MSRFNNLNAYDLHKHLINEYVLTKRGTTKTLTRDTSRDKRDIDVIRENHKFLWDDNPADTWEKQLAKKYYDKLFKEYTICDLSRYKENKVALRWRTENEVIDGKGQFSCGNKKCMIRESLKSWEVNFGYIEDEEKKNALVKLRLCTDCSTKLNYHTKKREIKRLKKSDKKKSSKKKPTTDTSKVIETVESDTDDIPSTSTENKVTPPEIEPWKKTVELEEKSRDEEFESYLEDLLL